MVKGGSSCLWDAVCGFTLENELKKYELVKKDYCVKESNREHRLLIPQLCRSVLYKQNENSKGPFKVTWRGWADGSVGKAFALQV